MKAICRFLVIGVLLHCFTPSITAQVVGYSFERRQIHSQLRSNTVPAFYGVMVNAVSITGNLTGGDVRGPLVTNLLGGSGALVNFRTNWPALDTNQISGSTNLNAAYPTGTYQLNITYKPLLTTLTNTQNFDLTNDFPTVLPEVTNIAPFSALSASQVFQWPSFAGSTNDHASFYLLEGVVDTNKVIELLEAFKEEGTQALTNAVLNATNNLTFLARERNIGAGTNSITVNGIDPMSGHLAVLQFHNISQTTNVLIPAEVASVSGSFIFYPRLQAPTLVIQPTNKIALTGGTAFFGAVAAGWPLFYQWYQNSNAIAGATSALLSITNAQASNAGAYHVTVTNSAGAVASTPVNLNVLAVTQLSFSLPVATNGGFQMALQSAAGITNVIEMSTNLIDWTNIAVLTNSTQFTDTNALGAPARFYRFLIAE